jgi:hypothetical protein
MDLVVHLLQGQDVLSLLPGQQFVLPDVAAEVLQDAGHGKQSESEQAGLDEIYDAFVDDKVEIDLAVDDQDGADSSKEHAQTGPEQEAAGSYRHDEQVGHAAAYPAAGVTDQDEENDVDQDDRDELRCFQCAVAGKQSAQ